MPNILKNESLKDVTEGSSSTNSVAITKHQSIFTITDTVHEVYKIPQESSTSLKITQNLNEFSHK